MEKNYPIPYSSIKFFFCSGIFLSLSIQAAPIPQGSQLLPQNPRERIQSLQNDTGITVEKNKPLAPTSTATVKIRQIQIVGNTLFDTKTLHALVADGEGKDLNLGQLNELVSRISHYYQQKGYLVSRAYIPAQSIKDGVLQVNILEARYGAIQIKNNSRLSSSRASSMLSALRPNEMVETSQLNRSLLLLSDLPGIITHSTLGPGQAVGTSDLQTVIEPGDAINGSVGIDNYGSRYNGRARYNAALQFNNPTGQGDQLSLSGITSGRDLMYGYLGYKFPIYPGVNIGANYSAMSYRLKENLIPLDADGTQRVADVWLSYAWVREMNVNVNSTLRYTYKNMQDDKNAVDVYNRRHSNAASLENSAEFRDSYGKTNAYLALTYGNLTFKNANDGGAFDDESAKTAGNFTKANLHLSRQQQLTSQTLLYLGIDGQIANKNLDSSEQLTLGGPFSVRSYDVGTISGSQGYTASAELQHTLTLPIPGVWTPMVFVDTGRIQLYKDTFTSEPNIFNLSSTGVGLDVDWKGWNLSTRFAHRIGATPPATVVSRVDNNTVWARFSKSF